jgi:two-component system, OmpR family, KDP operon response regulator KdpE
MVTPQILTFSFAWRDYSEGELANQVQHVMKILVVDDEPKIGKLIRSGLAAHGYEVLLAENDQQATNFIAQEIPALVLLDIDLGTDSNGVDLCRALREWTTVPIIMLSVYTHEKMKVAALDAGADDYITKPFGLKELRARIQAVLRRMGDKKPEDFPEAEIHAGQLHIDRIHRRVFVQEQEIHLTPKEYDLLNLLADHPGKVLTHQTILTNIWGAEQRQADHYVRVFINQLRKKLQENPARNIRYILNEPGIGYRFIDQSME